ncbi:Zinc finger DNA binding protein [Operophtera brumata]|uniref:Zinc finger DNA binding protein n=1 Tax=Operophtera brumata TaxID=104452 RepID=A0A0L7L026_OPEBR|nr:Zinc finger DNA binding protein [Operophtera brumata]
MPRVHRSPPPALSASPAPLVPPLTHSVSESNLTGSPKAAMDSIAVPTLSRDATSDPNITLRRRKREEFSREDVSEMFSLFKQEQDQRFTALLNKIQDGIQTHTEQNAKILSSIDFLGQKYDEMVSRIDSLEREKSADRKYIQSLEARLDQLDRSLRGSSIEVRNVPKKAGESKEDLLNLIAKVGGALNVPVQQTEVRDVYRINTKSETNQPIVAEFTSVILRDKIVSSVKSYNKKYTTTKFSTSNLKLEGPTKPIFISESLAPQTKKLFFMAREFAKSSDFKFCWASRGKIYLRRSDGAALIKVNNESDLENLKSN